MFVSPEDVEKKQVNDFSVRRVLAHGGKMMALRWDFEKGAQLAEHSHPHEQIAYIIAGKFSFTVDGKQQICKEGDTFYAEPNVLHGGTCLEKGSVLDIFTPQREDFLQ